MTVQGLIGTTVISDRSPVAAATATWAGLALDGRPLQTSTLEGDVPADLRSLLDADVNTNSRLRSQTQLAWGVVPLPTPDATAATDECFGANALVGSWPQGDPALCQRAGIVYLASEVSWQGAHAPPATDNVTTARFITRVDSIGRSLAALEAGDTRRTDDDVCRVTTFATPATGDRVTTAIATERLTDCGWGHPNYTGLNLTPGPPVTIAGLRFAYDGMPEGQVTRGRLTQRTTERYDVRSGTWLGQTADGFDHDEVGNVRLVQRNRALGVPATQSVFVTYDPWAATATSVTTVATGAAPTVDRRDASAWPSVPERVTSPTGEVSTSEHDRFGRPRRTTIETASGTRYLLGAASYDDTPGARAVTAIAYLGDVPDDGSAASGPSTRTTTRLDALGRPVLSWTERGADYAGILVGRWLHYDQLGRVLYSADPFAATALPAWTGPGTVDGVSIVYDGAGRALREVRARRQVDDAPRTDRSIDQYLTTNAYTWRDGRAIVTTWDADANDPTSPRHDLQGSAEVATTAIGWVADRTRFRSTTPIDRVTQFYDRLGQMVRLRRYADPAAGTLPVDWDDAYDSVGLRLSSTEPGRSPTTSTYDDWGELLSSTWTDGATQRRWRTEYDGLGRPTVRELATIAPPLVTVETSETLTYDQVVDANRQKAGPFLGRLSSSSVANVATVFYGYDALGHIAMESWLRAGETKAWTTRPQTTAGGLSVALDYETATDKDRAEYAYDSAGQVRAVAFGPPGSLTQVWKAETVDALGRYRSVLLGNGARERFTFRDTGHRELTEWSAIATDGTLIRHPSAYDAFGRATVIDEVAVAPGQAAVNSQSAYGYDLLGRLTSASTSGPTGVAANDRYTYDALGNVATHTDVLVGANSQTIRRDATDLDRACWVGSLGGGSGAPCNISYDGGGNVTRLGAGTTARTFTYDPAARLVRVVRGSDQEAITYGPGDATVTEKVTKSGAPVSEVRRYGDRLSWQTHTNGATFDERVISGPLGPIALARGTGPERTVIYVHGDGQGNRLFTGKNGAVVQSNRFAPFGAVRTPTGVPGAITYTDALWNGGEQADPFGIDLLGARAYDPVLGRFLQRDPLAMTATASHAHPYAFAWSDPVNHADPTGLSPGGPCDELSDCGGGWQVGGSAGLSVMPVPFGFAAATAFAPTAAVPFTGAAAGGATAGGVGALEGAGSGLLYDTAAFAPAAAIIGFSIYAAIKHPELVQGVCPVDRELMCTRRDQALADRREVQERYYQNQQIIAIRTTSAHTTSEIYATTTNHMVMESLSNAYARSLSRTLDNAQSGDPASLPIVVFDGAIGPQLVTNMANAIAAGHPRLVHYNGGGDVRNANRTQATGGIPAFIGESIDEYPFASTMEGGTGAWVGHVPTIQQSYQGGTLGVFYRRNHMKAGDPFLVFRINVPP